MEYLSKQFHHDDYTKEMQPLRDAGPIYEIEGNELFVASRIIFMPDGVVYWRREGLSSARKYVNWNQLPYFYIGHFELTNTEVRVTFKSDAPRTILKLKKEKMKVFAATIDAFRQSGQIPGNLVFVKL